MVSELFIAGVVWGSVAVVAGSTVLAWRQRPKPGATAFAATMLAATWWVTASSIALFTTDRGASLFWATVEWVGIAALPVAWLAFALAYTGRSEYLSRRVVALLSVPSAATVAFVLTHGVYHDLAFGAPTFHSGGAIMVVERPLGVALWGFVGYTYLLLAAGTALVVQVVAERRPLYRGQAFALVLVIAAPWVGSAVYLAGLSPVPFFDPTPYTFVISGAAGIAALTQFQFLDAIPVTSRVAHRSVVENVDAGVLVADTGGQVVDANPRATALLADDGGTPVGDPVDEWLPAEARADGTLVVDDTDSRTRYLEVSVTELTDDYGNVTGRIFLLRDVTDRRNRVQRLNVLNRVLRHNLRNEMNVIYGEADRLAHGDEDPEVVADRIRGKASELTTLADKAREIDGILGEAESGSTDLCRVAAIEGSRIEEIYRGVDVEVRTPERALPVDAVAGTIVRNVVENAAEHNTADDPRVRIEVTADECEGDGDGDDEARVVVTDNGPGIPPGELAALDGDLETQLDHASGLGLWLVHWGVAAVGGDVDVAPRDPVGTRVTVTVPLVDDAGPDSTVDTVDAASVTSVGTATASGGQSSVGEDSPEEPEGPTVGGEQPASDG